MSIKYFLRNEGPSSQKRTFAQRQWIQHVLFLFFSQHVFQSIWPWVFDVKQLFSQKWNLDTESNPAWKSPLLSKEVFVYVFSKRTAYKMKNICFFKLLELQGFQKPQLLSKEVFVYVFTKWAAYKVNKVCFFKLFELQGFQNPQLLLKDVFVYVFTKRET